MEIKIGFYICHCGINIAHKVRVEEVADYIRGLRNVVVSRDYKFMCSDPGQEMIENDIKTYGLNRGGGGLLLTTGCMRKPFRAPVSGRG